MLNLFRNVQRNASPTLISQVNYRLWLCVVLRVDVNTRSNTTINTKSMLIQEVILSSTDNGSYKLGGINYLLRIKAACCVQQKGKCVTGPPPSHFRSRPIQVVFNSDGPLVSVQDYALMMRKSWSQQHT